MMMTGWSVLPVSQPDYQPARLSVCCLDVGRGIVTVTVRYCTVLDCTAHLWLLTYLAVS